MGSGRNGENNMLNITPVLVHVVGMVLYFGLKVLSCSVWVITSTMAWLSRKPRNEMKKMCS